MLSIYMERSQTSQPQISEPEHTPACPPTAESAYEAQLRQLGPASVAEATTGEASAGQATLLRAVSQPLPPPQQYALPQQPQTAAAPPTISPLSSAASLGLLQRQPGAAPGYQVPRCARHRFPPSLMLYESLQQALMYHHECSCVRAPAALTVY